MQSRKKEGKPLRDTADMKMWREEFSEMGVEQHDKILKNLGLDEEDIEEFNENFNGKKSVEQTLGLGAESDATEEFKEKKSKKG